MNNVNVNTNQAQTNSEYFNGVLYARVFVNEVKTIQPKNKKAKQYCAVKATILGKNAKGKNTYETIDLIVKGQNAKTLLWKHREQWPTNRFEKSDWIADVNIGSIGHCGFEKKDGTPGAVLKGRLINIRSLKIGNDVVFGEMKDYTNPSFVSPAYINLVDNNFFENGEGIAQASLLEGKVGEHNYQFITLYYKDIEAFKKMESKGLCPKGYEHRDTNPTVFAILELSKIEAIGYKNKEDGEKSYLSGELAKVRYLKVNDEVLTQQSVTEEVTESVKEEKELKNAA